MELGEDVLKRTTDARQSAASAGKSSSTKHPQGGAVVKMEQVDCPFHEPATGSGRSRAISRLAPTGSLQAEAAIGCEPSPFSVGQVRPLVLERLTRNRRIVTT